MSVAEATGSRAKQAAFLALLKKMREGAKLTAADYDFLDAMEAQEARAQPAREDDFGSTGGATLEEDLEEWTLCDGVVRGKHRRIAELMSAHQITERALKTALWRTQRKILALYGWEGSRRSGPLSGNENLVLQWAKSIHQSGRAFRVWNIKMEEVERMGSAISMDEFTEMVTNLRYLQEKRDGLVLKVQRLREMASRSNSASPGQAFHVVVHDS